MDDFPGFNVIIEGPPGSGKTFSIGTAVQEGFEVFYLDIDSSLETLVGFWADRGVPIPKNFHFHHLTPKTQGFGAMIKAADATAKFTMSALAKMVDNERHLSNQFMSLLEILNNFIDQKDGKNWGPVDQWPSNYILVIDSLTALNEVTFDMVVGNRPMRDKPDYGNAQVMEGNLLKKLTKGCICSFVLIAHVDRYVDEVLGGIKLMPVTIGQAMKSTLGIPFSDVILASNVGDQWYWSTSDGQADLKTRNLPKASKLVPSFKPLMATWAKRRDASSASGIKGDPLDK